MRNSLLSYFTTKSGIQSSNGSFGKKLFTTDFNSSLSLFLTSSCPLTPEPLMVKLRGYATISSERSNGVAKPQLDE